MAFLPPRSGSGAKQMPAIDSVDKCVSRHLYKHFGEEISCKEFVHRLAKYLVIFPDYNKSLNLCLDHNTSQRGFILLKNKLFKNER